MKFKNTYYLEIEDIKGSIECIGEIEKERGVFSFDISAAWLHIGRDRMQITDASIIGALEHQIDKEMPLVDDWNDLKDAYDLSNGND